MTHRVEEGDYEDPREALQAEFARTPELDKKLGESKRRMSLVRAARIDEGLDSVIRAILGGRHS